MVKKKGKKGNSKQIQYRKSNNLLFKYIFVFFVGIFFALFFTNAFTLIKTNIDNAIQVIKRTYFTDSGTLSGNVMMDINAIDGNIFISGSYLSFGSGNFLGLTNSGYLIFLSGAMGPQGPAGIDGTSIVSGWVQSGILYLQYSGANGTGIWNGGNIQGAKGETGDTGPQGPAGIDGTSIMSGWVQSGILYLQYSGANGTGIWNGGNIQGAKGETGDTGPQGPTGAKGETGDTGLQGPTGATGSNGIDGNTGATGPQGIQGNTGAIGATGFLQAGITGATPFWDGIQWITDNTNIFNTGFNIGIATVLPTAKLDINGNLRIRDVEYNGSLTGVLVIDASGFVYQSDASLFVGTGPRGATGAKGETGEAGTPGGPPGATGAIGPTGFLQAGITGATPFWDGIQWITDNTNIFNTGFNIGIATILPTAKLDINGNLRIRDVEYNGSLTGILVIDASGFVYRNDSSLLVGPQGPAGARGTTGATGPQGNTGATGPQGINGNTGATGPQGIQGNTGAIGATGEQGVQGNTGAKGETGDTGLQGPTGVTGSNGIDGNTGATGPQGIQGNTGAKGETGFLQAGITGATPFWDGTDWITNSTNIFNTGFNIGIATILPTAKLDINGNLRIRDVQYNGSLTGILVIDASGFVYRNDSSLLVGPQGPAGATGAKGETGDTGPTGPAGARGTTGTNGIDGNTGATGPQGIQGNTGAKGETGEAGTPGGPPGATGAIGPTGFLQAGITGATPFWDGIQWITDNTNIFNTGFNIGIATILPTAKLDINGNLRIRDVQYNGSLTGILVIDASGFVYRNDSSLLVGPQGPAGARGTTGATGPQGNTGATGPQGIQGNTGAIGPQGIQGNTGAKGETGDTGPQGPIGARGTTGTNGIDGNTGATGPQGIQGNTGATGATGFLQAGITGATPFWDGIQWITDNTNIFNTGFNIGIATILPTAKLDINGNLRIRDVPYSGSLTGILVIDASGFVYRNDSSLLVGPQGPAGATGAKGETGDTGPTGPAGARGTTGTNGIDGNTGATGPQGIQGNTGAKGETGEAGTPGGPPGATGAIGPTGFLQAGITGATPFWDGIQWITDNTNIFNTGFNIGIGTIFPITKLDISGDLRIGIIDNNNSMNQILGVVAGENIVKWIDQSLLGYWSGNGNNIYNKNIGNVGIGNINPSVALQVSGSVIFGTTGSKIINSDYSMIAGSQNIIDESDYSIALGATNVITGYSTNSTIAGGNLCSIVGSSNSTIAGGNNNKIDGSMNSSIGGGITNLIGSGINKATFYGFIGGGMSNILYGGYGFIGGGRYNFIDEFVNGVDNDGLSSIVGGESNEIYNLKGGFIGGGKQNKINSGSDYSVIVGGELNAIYTGSPYSTIMGGAGHHISGANSFAAGRSVYINNDNVFAWNGDMLLPFSSTTDNTFLINAGSGVAINHASPSSALDVNGDVEIVTGYAYYLGDPTTTGTWRITTKNGNLSFQIYTGGNWIERSHVSP